LIARPLPTERSFGICVGLACTVLGALSWWRDHPLPASILTVLGVALIVGGLVAPAALRVPNRIWWRFAHILGWVNARILLTLFFVLVLTPVGYLTRLFGRDPLRRRTRMASNWTPSPERRRSTSHYEQLY